MHCDASEHTMNIVDRKSYSDIKRRPLRERSVFEITETPREMVSYEKPIPTFGRDKDRMAIESALHKAFAQVLAAPAGARPLSSPRRIR